MTKFLLLLVILATACAAPQSLNNPQSRNNPREGNKPCVIGASKTGSEQKTQQVNVRKSPTIAPPVDTDPTNHYYFSAPLDTVNNARQEYREVPDEIRYNIIFVRVPPFVPKVQEEIELQPKTDEKTTVYVLVKRPEDPEIIKLPKLKTVQDEKPEVIVVKYNEDKDIQAEIEGVKQSKIFGDLGIARTSQVSESQVNENLKQLKKEDITQLTLVDDTRIPSNQQSTRIINSQSGSSSAVQDYRYEDGEETDPSSSNTNNRNPPIDGSSANEEDSDYGNEEESIPLPVTQRPARNNPNEETEADKNSRLYGDEFFEANNLKFDKKNQ